MTLFTFVEPKDSFGAKNAVWQLIIEEVLKFTKGEVKFEINTPLFRGFVRELKALEDRESLERKRNPAA